MTDRQILELIQKRDEHGLKEIETVYGPRLQRIAEGLLSREDAEECVNDTYYALWNHIPPDEPENLLAYMIRIVKNRARDRWREKNAAKRSGEVVEFSELLSSSVPDPASNTEEAAVLCASDVLNRFLSGLSREKRTLFVLRFWYGKSVEEIASLLGFSVAKTQKTLSRLKNDFKISLREGL